MNKLITTFSIRLLPLYLLFCLPGLMSAAERFFTVDLKQNQEVHQLKVKVERFVNENTFVTIFDSLELMRRTGSELTLHINEEHLSGGQMMAYLQTIYAAKNNFVGKVTIDLSQIDSINNVINLWDYKELNPLYLFSVVGGNSVKLKSGLYSLRSLTKSLHLKKRISTTPTVNSKEFIVTGSTHPGLRDKIISVLQEKGFAESSNEVVTGRKIFVIGAPGLSLGGKGPDADDNFFTALQEIAHYNQLGGKVSMVWGYKPYARSDKKDDQKENCRKIAIYSAMTDLLEEAVGVQAIIYVRAHVSQSQGFTHVPTINISLHDLLGDYLKQKLGINHVVAPDAGAEKDDSRFADRIGSSLSVLMKHRDPFTQKVETKNYGTTSLENQVVAIIDDETASGSTLANAAEILKQSGAKSVIAAVSHLSGDAAAAFKAMDNKLINHLVVTDTMPHTALLDSRVQVVSVATKIADEIITFLK